MSQAMGRALEDTKFLAIQVNSRGNGCAPTSTIPYDGRVVNDLYPELRDL